MQLSIIIPTLNEADNIERLIKHLHEIANANTEIEIIVSDAGSSDNTLKTLKGLDVKIDHSPIANRAIQMNRGVSLSSGGILYFLHADTFPPNHYDRLIIENVKRGTDAGCFRLKFDWDHPILRLYGSFTKFKMNIFRGGDQSLFVERNFFLKIGGFDEYLSLMEDYEIFERIKKQGKYAIMTQKVVSSAIKYRRNGVFLLQWKYFIIQLMYRLGQSQERLVNYYKSNIK